MSGTPWFGLYLPQLRMSFDTILARTQKAEAAGFDSVWLMDHLAAPMSPELDTFEGYTLAAALAARTETIRIGHLTTCDPFRHPALLAKMVATLDVISDGRIELGLGWGSVEHELYSFGFGPDGKRARAARLRETLDVLALMFGGDPFDYDGEFVQIRGAIGRPVPTQDNVPIHIGGAGEQLTMPIVAEHADWWNCPSYAYERLDTLMQLKGDARVSVQRPIGLVTDDSVRSEVEQQTERRFGGWGGTLVGNSEEVAAALTDDVDRGVEGFVVQLHDFGRAETARAFQEHVVPNVSA